MVYGVAILGAGRAVDHSRSGHRARATAYGALAAMSVVAVVAAVVLGIAAMARA